MGDRDARINLNVLLCQAEFRNAEVLLLVFELLVTLV